MDREQLTRLIVLAVLSMAIIFGWQYYQTHYGSEKPAAPAPAAPSSAASATTDQSTDSAAEVEIAPGVLAAKGYEIDSRKPDDVAAYQGPLLGDTQRFGSYAMAVRLTAQGAAIRHVELADYFASATDREMPDDAGRRMQLIQADVGRPSFPLTAIEFVNKSDGKKRQLGGLDSAWWTLDKAPTPESAEAVFHLDIKRQVRRQVEGQTEEQVATEPFLTIRKTFRLPGRQGASADEPFASGQAYGIEMLVDVIDHTQKLDSVAFTLRGPEGLVREESRGDGRLAVAGFADLKRGAQFKNGGDAEKEEIEKRRFDPNLDWAGVVDKYFGVVAVANPVDPAVTTGRFERAVAYLAYTEPGDHKVPGVLMTNYQTGFVPGDGRAISSQRYLIYAGPKDSRLLDQPLYAQFGLDRLIQWSRGCCFISIPGLDALIAGIAKLMVWGIDQISRVVVNKGIAIIILVLLVRILMFPVSRYSQLSMIHMQELQPELAKLKEKHKGDQQKYQMEQMKLLREHGANPMLGCLPMLLQMPIWIALYTGLTVAISLRQAPFFLWINDLAQPDRLFGPIAPVQVPIINWLGNWAQWEFNLLPFLMVIAMYLQMKMQPQAAATSPEMEKQQKMMKVFMPFMLLFFLYTAPSGLNLYIFTSSLYGYAEQRVIRWHYQQRKEQQRLNPKPPKAKGRFATWLESKMENAQKLQQAAKKSENRWEKPRRK